MALYEALSFANAYPVVRVGAGISQSKDVVKFISDKMSTVHNDLNPNFYKMYAVDATIPFDCKVEIKIMNAGMVDREIGSFTIDLEDRVLSEKLLRQRITYEIL
jgi:hypothetical protein